MKLSIFDNGIRYYSTQECPCCKTRYKPSSRYYSCRNALCNFKYDRDGIGAINIWLWNQ
ncbi:MAG: zinc ribbon domain-containing protein, partial [Fusobacteriaceae bacterium]